MYECAKPWREADADVAEAIDFCEYYAREMIRLSVPWGRDVPGEIERHRADRTRGGRSDPALELPAGDSDRDDSRRLGGWKYGRPQAQRAIDDDGLDPG